MKAQQMNRTEKKPEKLTKQEKVYNMLQKAKAREASRKKPATA